MGCRSVQAACAVLALLYAVFAIHGFSISAWHFLDGSPRVELLLGEAQGVRSDDWAVWLPYAFSQLSHDPPLPLTNRNIGVGQNMALIGSAAIADPIVIFRPGVWGYFVGPDTGMGWCWGVYVFGFIAAFHLLFMEISGRSGLSLAAAVALLFSPFFQFWSLNGALVAATVALAVVAAHRMLFASSNRARWLWGLALGWSTGAFALTLYPPFQIALGWFGVFTLLGLVLRSRSSGRTPRFDVHFAGAALCALLIAGFAGVRLLEIAGDAVARVQATLYPGQRLVAGGGAELWRVFSNNVFPHFFVRASPALGGNICEAASFVLFFPLVAFALLRAGNRRALAADPLLLSLFAAIALLVGWGLVGLPAPLARASGLAKVPESRAAIGYGVADMTLIVALLGSPRVQPVRFAAKWSLVAIVAVIGLLLAGELFAIARRDAQLLQPGALLQAALLVAAQLAIALLLLRKRAAALALFAALNVASTAWFNPVVHGGFEQIWSNPVSAKIRELDSAKGGGSSWLVFNDLVIGQLPPMLGVRSLAATEFYPQSQIWDVLDPEHRQTDAYNRYAHIAFAATAAPAPLRIQSPDEDVTVVHVHPDDPKLLALPFDYAIHAGDPPDSLRRSPNYRLVQRIGEISFFERRRAASTESPASSSTAVEGSGIASAGP
jgi:hypothetical protein